MHADADDTTLVSNSEEKFQHLLDIRVNEGNEKGLCISIKKTECMIDIKKTTPIHKICVCDKRIRQAESFNYLGSTVTSNCKCDVDIKKRTALEKASFAKMTNILKNGILLIETKLRVLCCYVFFIWTISKTMERGLKPADM